MRLKLAEQKKHAKTAAVIIGAAAALTVFACKQRQTGSSAAKDLEPGGAMSTNVQLMDSPDIRHKKPILIYYANDTYAPTDDDPAYVNKEALISKLNAGLAAPNLQPGQADKLRAISGRIASDWNNFRRIVDTDVRFLLGEICKPNARFDMGLVTFRNFGNDSTGSGTNPAFDFERSFSYTYCMPGERPNVSSLSIPNFNNDWRYQSQPLSHAFVFRKAIDEVMKVFPPSAYRYVLITKSHGGRDVSIAPHLAVDVRAIPDADIWGAVINNTASNAGLDADKMTNPILDAVDGVLTSTDNVTRQSTLPQPAGVTKKDYLQILFRNGGGDPRRGMFFPIVFMEACKSDLRLSSDADIQSVLAQNHESYAGFHMENIGLLYTSDLKGLGYQTIDYRELFGFRFANIPDFQDVMRSYLDGKAAPATAGDEPESAPQSDTAPAQDAAPPPG